MVPFESIVIPLYVVVQRMGISNTYSALILPAIANGMAIFLFRQFFADIPTELLEAARVDGASWARVFFQFLLPLSKPALVSVMIMLFLFNWNALFWPLVAVHSSDLEVVQVAVTTHVAQGRNSLGPTCLVQLLLLVYHRCYYSCSTDDICTRNQWNWIKVRCFECIKTIFNCRVEQIPEMVFLPGDPERVDEISRYLSNVQHLGNNREYRMVSGEIDGTSVGVCSTGMGRTIHGNCGGGAF